MQKLTGIGWSYIRGVALTISSSVFAFMFKGLSVLLFALG
jgi:hypothetical protein